MSSIKLISMQKKQVSVAYFNLKVTSNQVDSNCNNVEYPINCNFHFPFFFNFEASAKIVPQSNTTENVNDDQMHVKHTKSDQKWLIFVTLPKFVDEEASHKLDMHHYSTFP